MERLVIKCPGETLWKQTDDWKQIKGPNKKLRINKGSLAKLREIRAPEITHQHLSDKGTVGTQQSCNNVSESRWSSSVPC